MLALETMILNEWVHDVPKEVMAAAQDIAKRYPGGTVHGLLFYGSCLRTGEIEDKILDFYVIVDDYMAAYGHRGLALSNKILPPNVFYHEMDVDGMTVRSKYAVLSREDLAFRTSEKCLNVSVWARFCQPCVLLLASEESKVKIAADIARAVRTMLTHSLSVLPAGTPYKDVWVQAFERTYASELRSERSGKGHELYLLDNDRYERISPIAFAEIGYDHRVPSEGKQPARLPVLKAKFLWVQRTWNGKLVSLMRLIKASFTFDGGIDYLAWKIRRHSGVDIEITDWMRKHPILAGLKYFISSRKKGAFK